MKILLLLLLLTGCMATDSADQADRPGPHGLYINGGFGGF
jgi:hypothetical protein